MLEPFVPTKRDVIDLLRPCNANCEFCYYRWTGGSGGFGHAQNWSMPVDEALAKLDEIKRRGNDFVDFTGGEPTIYKALPMLLEHCKNIGLIPCIITNGLADHFKFEEYLDVNPDTRFLLSLHGVTPETHDEAVGVTGAFSKLSSVMKLLRDRDVFFRTNTVITRRNHRELARIADYARLCGSRMSNFIFFQPFHDWDQEKNDNVQVPPDVAAPYIEAAIQCARRMNYWVQLRYYPFCCLSQDCWQHICGVHQVMFDPYEWSYNAPSRDVPFFLKKGRERARDRYGKGNDVCDLCQIRGVCGGNYETRTNMYGTDGLKAMVSMHADHIFQFREDLRVDIIIPSYRAEALPGIMEEIVRTTVQPYRIIIQGDETHACVNRQRGLEAANAPYVIMVDDDIRNLPIGWNRDLVEALRANPQLCALSARLIDSNGKFAPNSANNFDGSKSLVRVPLIPTACCIFRRPSEASFDLRYRGSGFEDTDFFLQLKKDMGEGCEGIAICNDVRVTHLHEKKEQGRFYNYNKNLFESKWGSLRKIMGG